MSNIFKQTDFRLRKSIAKVNFLSQFPKITVETVVILTIIAGSLILFDSDVNSSRIAVLGLIAFGSQKLIPVCQLLYFNFIKIYNSRANLSNYLSYLVSEHVPNSLVRAFHSLYHNHNLLIFLQLKQASFIISTQIQNSMH